MPRRLPLEVHMAYRVNFDGGPVVPASSSNYTKISLAS